MRDLDFTDTGSYRSPAKQSEYTVADWSNSNDTGWSPIGDYNALFEGNGHTISNLMINRPNADDVGLFGSLVGTTVKFFNIGLLNVKINGAYNTGGLVGYFEEGTIKNSYASGSVAGNEFVGGLVGNYGDLTVTHSYWDKVETGISTSANSPNSDGKTMGDLTGPTEAKGIYENWDDMDWDFGTAEQYPALKYARTDSARACRKLEDEVQSQQPVCGTLLPGQKSAPPTITIPPLDPLPLGTTTTLIVVIEDVDSDSISVQLDSSNLTVATATIVAINDTNYTLELTGSSAGTAEITVTASDDEGSSTEEMFTILVDAEPTGMVTINLDDSDDDTWRLVTTSTVVDANGIDETKTIYEWFRNELPQSETSNIYRISNDNSGRNGGTKYKVEVTIVDKIGQSATVSSNVYMVKNLAPVINSVMSTKQNYNEGDSVLVTTKASDANRDVLTYTLSVNQGARRINKFNRVSGGATLNFDVPPNWINDDKTADKPEPLQLEVTVSDGSEITMQTTSVVVTKVDNDTVRQPSISLVDGDPNEFKLGQINPALDPDGRNDGNYNLNYQWQRCLANTNIDCSTESDNWQPIGMPITDPTDRSLTVPDDLRMDGIRFRVQILYTDGQGYRADDFFSDIRSYSANPAVKVRAKVFLEGPLQ